MINYILECEGETRQEAEKKSLEILQLSSEDIEFETVSTGVLKRIFKSEPVLLRSLPRNEKLSQESIARGIIHTLLSKLNIKAELQGIEEEDGNLYMSLESEQSAQIIGKYGRALDSLQFLLNLLVSKWIRQNKRIILDVSNYRKKRLESIHALCEKIADKVARSGRGATLNYMSPYERRIAHLFLEEDEDVYTESIGNGVYKRVQILPYKKEDSKKDRENYPEHEEHPTQGDNSGNYKEDDSEQDDGLGNYKEDYDDDNDDNDNDDNDDNDDDNDDDNEPLDEEKKSKE